MMGKILSSLIDILYPLKSKCVFCGSMSADIGDAGLCGYCISLLPYISGRTCIKCGRPMQDEYTGSICPECASKHIYFDGGCTVFEFSGILQSGLYRLKYGCETQLAEAFGKLMAADAIKMGWDIDLIVPVPLHPERFSERGFNQSWLLSTVIGREWGVDSSDRVLERIRHTPSQTTLSGKMRLLNVRGAFAVTNKAKIQGKSILIVDDIMTTGSTLNECSRMLKTAGASRVYCLTAACPTHFE